jgi:hypothetical protein
VACRVPTWRFLVVRGLEPLMSWRAIVHLIMCERGSVAAEVDKVVCFSNGQQGSMSMR